MAGPDETTNPSTMDEAALALILAQHRPGAIIHKLETQIVDAIKKATIEPDVLRLSRDRRYSPMLHDALLLQRFGGTITYIGNSFTTVRVDRDFSGIYNGRYRGVLDPAQEIFFAEVGRGLKVA